MPEESERTRPRAVPRLAEIASVFARYANTTFGGGSATIAGRIGAAEAVAGGEPDRVSASGG
jgi:hypothetical protein